VKIFLSGITDFRHETKVRVDLGMVTNGNPGGDSPFAKITVLMDKNSIKELTISQIQDAAIKEALAAFDLKIDD
jgi:hypothetical protein